MNTANPIRRLDVNMRIETQFLVFIPLLVTISVFAGCDSGQKINLNQNDEIYFGGGATEHDARKVGELLTKAGHLGFPEGASVKVEKSSGVFCVYLCVADGAWNDQAFKKRLRFLPMSIAEALDHPTSLKLCDQQFREKATITINN